MDILQGGLADNKEIGDIIAIHNEELENAGFLSWEKKYNKILQQVKKGIETELEHTNKEVLAKEIALDHLVESPFYYDNLEKMEKRMENYSQRMRELIGTSKNPNKKKIFSEEFIMNKKVLNYLHEQKEQKSNNLLNEEIDPELFEIHEFENELEIDDSDETLYSLEEGFLFNESDKLKLINDIAKLRNSGIDPRLKGDTIIFNNENVIIKPTENGKYEIYTFDIDEDPYSEDANYTNNFTASIEDIISMFNKGEGSSDNSFKPMPAINEDEILELDFLNEFYEKIKDFNENEDFELITDSQDVKQLIKDYREGPFTYYNEIGGAFVKFDNDGEAEEIYVFEGSIPTLDKRVWQLFPDDEYYQGFGDEYSDFEHGLNDE